MLKGRKRAAAQRGEARSRTKKVRTPKHKRAPNRLPTSTSFYRALIEQTTDLVSVLAVDGSFLYASPSHRRILGYDPASLVGQNTFDFVHEADREALLARFRAAVSHPGQTASDQYRYRHGDGSWRVLEAVGTNLVADPSIGGLVVNARDVTDRVRAEARLEEQRSVLADRLAELELFYRTAPVGLAFVDCHLRFVRINDRLAEMNGLPPAAHIGRSIREVIPGLADIIEPIHRQVIANGEPLLGLDIHGRSPAAPDVEKDWLASYYRLDDSAGNALGVTVVVLDITELKTAERELQRAREELEIRVRERTADLVSANESLHAQIAERARVEQSLRESEARYRDLVESINEVIFTMDAQGHITYVSPAIERIAGGRRADEVIGRRFLDFIHADDAPAVVESFQRLLNGQSEPLEYRAIGRNGNVYWLHSRSHAIVKDGQLVAVQGVLTDVTALRQAEMEARQRRQGLAHMQRLTTAGAMTAEIAHQINQPLAAIMNFAGGLAARLRDGAVEPEMMRAVAGRISDEALRASEVIRRLRAFLRKGESVQRDCHLNELVRHVLNLLDDDFRRESVDVDLRLDSRLPLCRVDPVLMEQVILNLVRNALEAMTGCSTPSILQCTTAQDEMMIEVRVSDTGVGLSSEAADRIFEAFFTTKPDGLGLGLSVSRSIVEASGGRLWVERNHPRGTTVVFTLPCGAHVAAS